MHLSFMSSEVPTHGKPQPFINNSSTKRLDSQSNKSRTAIPVVMIYRANTINANIVSTVEFIKPTSSIAPHSNRLALQGEWSKFKIRIIY